MKILWDATREARGMRCKECSSMDIGVDFDYGARYCKPCGAILEEVLYA